MTPKNSSTFDANANNEGITPLHEAARDGLLNIVKLLIEASMNPSAQDKNGRNALHYAAENGQHEVVRFLYEKVDPWLQDGAGLIPLHLAIKNEHYETVKIFRDVIKMRGGGLLHLAAAVGDIQYVQYLLSTDIDKNDQGEGGFTPLHIASGTGVIEVVNALLAAGVDPNTKSSAGYSGVIFAAVGSSNSPGPFRLKGVATDHIAVIKALVHAGADVNLDAGDGGDHAFTWKALHFAICDNREGTVMEEVVSVLLGEGAHVDACSGRTKQTALHLATKRGYANIVRLLLRKNADIDARDSNGLTPLHHSVKKGYVELVRLFLSYNADVSAKNVHGETALHFAVRAGNEEVVRMLLDRMSSLAKKSSRGKRNDIGSKSGEQNGDGTATPKRNKRRRT